MKNSLLLLLALLCCLPVLAQQKFVPDALGRVNGPAFKKLIKERGYTLVGTYDTVSREPLQLYARVLKNNKWGFIDAQGREAIEPQFEHIEGFNFGLAKVKDTNGKYYLVNLKGKPVSAEYESIQENSYGVAVVSSGNKKGAIGLDGRVAVPLKFDEILTYPKGIIAICNEKSSLYNHRGELLTPKAYDRLRWYGRFLKAYKGDTFCLLNSETGKPITNEWYSDKNDFLSSLAAAKIDDAYIDHTVLLVKNGTHYFLLDEKGNRISDEYEEIEQAYGPYSMWYVGHKDNEQWLLNDTGKRRAKIKGDVEFVDDQGNFFVTEDEEGREHYFNLKMEELDFSAYDEIDEFAHGLAAVLKAGKYGFADYTGRLVIEAVYDDTQYNFNTNGIRAVKQNGKWGFIDSTGVVVQPFEFDRIDSRSRGSFYYVYKEGKMGVITYNGEQKLAPVYDVIDDLRQPRYKNEQQGWLKVRQNGKWGVVNKELELLVVPLYDEIISNATMALGDEFLHVKMDGNRYLVTQKGEPIMPLDGEISGWGHGGIVYALPDGKLYCTDLYGNEQLVDE